ncbi:MAG: DUF4340 domain-containing protein [Gemmatimonadetes bacterium]|nr:DUF4340 domain-containing protein [Gemmatimonadota bacterium]
MTPKQLRLIARVLVVLLVLWGVSEFLSRRSDKTVGAKLYSAVPMSLTDSIVIARDTDTVRLVRYPKYWSVNGHRASALELEGFFKQVADTTPPEIAGESKAVHERMGLDSAKGRYVRVFSQGKPVIELIVGQRGPDYQSSFVRKSGEERVYLRLGPFAGFVDRGVDDWREHQQANIPVDSARRVDVTRHARRYALVRKDTVWQFSDGRPAESVLVQRLLRNLSPSNATGFATAEEAKKINFRNPDLRVVVIGTHDDTLTSLWADSMPNGYWVQHDSGGPIFRNGVWIADEIAPNDSTLRVRKR